MTTLEWLLILGAIAGLAAVSVLAVQRVVDTSSELPHRPDVLIIDAEIAAATAAGEATRLYEDDNASYAARAPAFQQRCTAIEDDFSDVVQLATWDDPAEGPPKTPQCTLTRRGSP